MQALSTISSLPLTAPDTADASALDIVAVLSGSTTFSMHGFREEKVQDLSSWAHPAAQFVKATNFEEEVEQLKVRRRKWRLVTLAFSAAALVAISFTAGLVAATATMDWGSKAIASASSWRVTEVNDTGVVIQMDNSQIPIPVGARLPSGDLILSVSAQRNTVFLESATLVVRTPAQQGTFK